MHTPSWPTHSQVFASVNTLEHQKEQSSDSKLAALLGVIPQRRYQTIRVAIGSRFLRQRSDRHLTLLTLEHTVSIRYGHDFESRYDLKEKVGSGSFGTVYRVTCKQTGEE